MGGVSRRLPAEWEAQDAVMLAWPHEATDWAPWLESVEASYEALALRIHHHQALLICCRDTPLQERLRRRLREAGADLGRIRFYTVPYNDTWVRDYGPLGVIADHEPRLLNFLFNGWGGKYPADLDNAVNRRLQDLGAWGDTPLESVDFVLEGGSIDSDGAGTLLTTSRCLLHPRRNPGLGRAEIERILQRHLGIQRLLWIENAFLAGDDTDGHIDMLARFCDPHTIVHSSCADPADEHFAPLREMARELAALRGADGRPYRLVPLPLPAARFDDEGQRLPASYANFLIINGAVLVPCYDDPADDQALETLAACFPGRQIHPIPALPLVLQHGSVHCVTMQLPEGIR